MYDQYLSRIFELLMNGKSKAQVARILKKEFELEQTEETIRKGVSRALESKTQNIEEYCSANGININNVKSYWHKGEGFSVNVKGGDSMSWDDVRDRILKELKEFSPKFEDISYSENIYGDGHCLVIDPADIHIGKLSKAFETGCEYNNQIAVERVKEGVRGILKRSSGFNIDQIVFIGGNDILHIDSPRRTTTSGTPQDTDGMWFENFMIAKNLYIDLIGSLLLLAPVHFVFNPSNHDYTHGFFLADVINTYFQGHNKFTSDTDLKHRKYYRYGNTMIGTTHGDGAKNDSLPLLMATEAPVMWAKTKHRYIYTHHVHHKTAKDFQGVTVESLRSPSGTDSWHHRNGLQHSPKAIEGYVHSKENGQVARLTHNF